MHYPKHLSPEQNLLRLSFMQTLAIAKPMEKFATWLITGCGVILGAVIVNVEAVSNALVAGNLRWGLILLVMSLVAGAISKQLGMSVAAGRALSEKIYEELESPEGAAALKGIAATKDALKKDLSSAYLPPIRGIMRRSFERGGTDYLSSEKRLVKLWCIQLYALWAQNIAAVAGLLTLTFGIKL